MPVRLARLLRAAAVTAAALGLLAPPASAASPPDLLDGASTRAVGPGGSPCSGRMSWGSVQDPSNALQAFVDHELLITCTSGGVVVDGLSELHYDLDLDQTNGFDTAYCGPVTYRCHALRRSPPQLLGLPLRHHVRFNMRRTDGSVWTGDSSICTGEGTSVVTCTYDQVFLVGSGGAETFG